MLVVFLFALLCLMTVSHSAPLACEDLVRPLDQFDPNDLEGRWSLVAGSTTLPTTLEDLKDRGSMTVYFSNSSETSVYTFTQVNRLGDNCYHLFHNFTIKNSTFTHKLDSFVNLTASFLYTSCQDCMLLRFVFEGRSMTMVDFYLFSRRRELEQREMEDFRAQMECVKMPAPDVMDPTKELCPKETISAPAAQTEEKTEEKEA
ncbi:uncharacterized protein [Pempheris klunzingeri]|uniref:uncharacterized protein n=1 Tax=Pempheris klunzingeri TaxID=3127111 RepID=UPI00398071A6